MFDIERDEAAGGWRIVASEGEAGRRTLLTDRDLGQSGYVERIRLALHRADNRGRRDERAIRVAALNGLLNPAPFASR